MLVQGMLLLCNDGGLQHMLTFPDSRVYKQYLVTLDEDQPLAPHAAERFSKGLSLEDGTRCAPATLEILSERQARVTLHEGLFHQVPSCLPACSMAR